VKKTAFTMIELIIVIVIAGILAAVVMPRFERDRLREATNQVVRHIQYTQHLAMVNDVYDATLVQTGPRPEWEMMMWAIHFRQTNNCYAISSDLNHNGSFDATETARDTMTNELLYSDGGCTQTTGESSSMLLNDKYNATVSVSGSCGGNSYIAFDGIGRPLKTFDVTNPITSPCNITLSSSGRNAIISIEPETGYTRITSID